MRSQCLDELLGSGGISPRFQPILELQGAAVRVRAVEALARGPIGSNMERAEILFDYVRRKHQEVRMDRACLIAHCEAARDLPRSIDLALNVHAVTLSRDASFVPFLCEVAAAWAIDPGRLIVEIVEHAPERAEASFGAALDSLRARGVRVAMDDISLGLSSCRLVPDCKPDYLKIARHLVNGCHADPYRRAVVDSIVILAGTIGARVVAEGVEQPADLVDLAERGIDLYQGHLFCPAVPLSQLDLAEVSTAGARVLGQPGADAAGTD